MKHEILTCKSLTRDEGDIQNNPFIVDIKEFNNIYDNYITITQLSPPATHHDHTYHL